MAVLGDFKGGPIEFGKAADDSRNDGGLANIPGVASDYDQHIGLTSSVSLLFRQPGQRGQLRQVLTQRTCGRAPDGLSGADDFGRENTRARSDNSFRLDARLVADSHL